MSDVEEENQVSEVEEHEHEDGDKPEPEESEGEEEEGLDKEKEAGAKRRKRKANYVQRLIKLINSYKNVLIATADFVGSHQLQQIRIALRGKAEILMGKNTVIRKVLRTEQQTNPKLAALLPLVSGNMGFVFTNQSLTEIREMIQDNKKPAPAKVGGFAPIDVWVEAGPTGMDPGQTAFFQALNIATKISRGSIEIINRVNLVKAGEKVTASHVALLSKLNIKPFSYGMVVSHAYENGSVYEAKVLDLSKDDLMKKWLRGVRFLAALSLAAGFPTQASITHSVVNAFKKLVAISLTTEYEFKQAQKYREAAGLNVTKKDDDEPKEDGDGDKEDGDKEDGDKEEEDGDKEEEEEGGEEEAEAEEEES
jgi:large subunit ribosomal protein LP0